MMLRKRLFIGSLIMVITFAFALIAVDSSFAGSEKESGKIIDQKAQKVTEKGPSEVIKSDSPVNSMKDKLPAPPEMGGEGSRGAGGITDLENWTPYYISIYADGYYKGTMAPWSKNWIYTGTYCPRLYGAAGFDDGSKYEWGPQSVCENKWRLFP